MSFKKHEPVVLGETSILIGDGNYSSKYPKASEFVKEGIPFISASDFLGREFNRDKMKYITPEMHAGLLKGHLKEKDVLVVVRGNGCGKVGLVPKEFSDANINAQLALLRADNETINPDYLYFLLSSEEYQRKLQMLCSGSAQPQLTIKTLKTLVLELPDIEIQRMVAKILSSLDEKIELNNQMNKTLEELTQALFKRWFVDFEFPNEEGQPYKSSGGEMIESELGMIPKGWDVKYLSDIVNNFDSKRIPLSKREREKREKIYPYYGAANIADYVDDFIFDGCYVLMGEDGTVIDNNGYPILQYVWGKFWVNNHAHVLQGKSYYSNEFVYLKLKSTNVQSLVTGAVQPKINQKNMNSIKVAVAPKEIHVEFNTIIESIYSQLKLNIEQNEGLKQLRDSLLPKLMSGEIRVSDLEE